jgi:hypothetical protein
MNRKVSIINLYANRQVPSGKELSHQELLNPTVWNRL